MAGTSGLATWLSLRAWPLRRKAAALLLVASVLPLLVMTALLLRRERAIVRDANVALLQARVDQVGHTMEAIHGGHQTAAARAARDPAIVAFCAGRPGARARALPSLQERLEVLRGDDPAIRGVGVLDSTGTVIAATEVQLVGVNLAYKHYFRLALRGDPASSDVYLSVPATGRVPTIAFTAPVRSRAGQVVGVYVIWLRAEALWEVMRGANDTAGRGSFFALFDRHGFRVGHSTNAKLLFHPAAPVPEEAARTMLAERRFQERTAELMTAVVSFPMDQISGHERRIFRRPVSPTNKVDNLAVSRHFPALGAYLVAHVPESEIEVRVVSVLPRVLPALAVGLVLALLASAFLMHHVVRPIREVAAAAEALERGDFPPEQAASTAVEPGPRDEVDRLNKSFRSMATSLAERDRSLRARNRDLEEVLASERRIRAELQQAQKMEAVGRLASGIAHDFNNLLVVILSCSGFLLEELPVGDPRRADLEEIRRAGQRAARLVTQLLAFARKSPDRLVRTDLDAIVRGIEKLVRRTIGEDIEVSFALAKAPCPVLADPCQLEQVILNLVVNARDAMPDGGRLRIETETFLRAPGGDASETAGSHVVLRVSDTGCGMTPEVVSRIFEPFFTTKEPGKGTGLGLSTVFGIVQQANATIAVQSQPGKGSTFTIRLPIHEAGGDEPASAPPTVEGHGATVLLVEDEEAVRRVAHRVLSRRGFRVLEAGSGDEALQRLRDADVDLVVSDVVMPGMSGPDLAARLQRIRPRLPVLFMSGYSDRQGTWDDGTVVLSKPFTEESLLGALDEALARRRRRQASGA